MSQTQTAYYLKFLGKLFLSVSIISCNEQRNSKAEKTAETELILHAEKEFVLDKLAGTWKSEYGKSFERWEKKDDGTFRSVAFSIKGGDTSWNEQATIYPVNNKWIFENTVHGQNEGKAVKFSSTILTANSIQFSNPAHDFPTDINYTLLDANRVNAFISGPNGKGGKDTVPFKYIRVKQ